MGYNLGHVAVSAICNIAFAILLARALVLSQQRSEVICAVTDSHDH